jgi:hypothetical protein
MLFARRSTHPTLLSEGLRDIFTSCTSSRILLVMPVVAEE